jgi:hypothetical protein
LLRQSFEKRHVLSTLFFKVVLKVIVRRENLETTGTIFNKQTQLLACADDTDIVGRSLEALRNAYLPLKGEAVKIGLKIKTEHMIAAANRSIRDATQTVAFGDKNFKVINELVCLKALV